MINIREIIDHAQLAYDLEPTRDNLIKLRDVCNEGLGTTTKSSIQHFQDVLGEWSEETFGTSDPQAPLHHMESEIQEVLNEPYNIEEYSDCFMLLLDALRKAGFTADQLIEAAYAKLEVNKSRIWGSPNALGYTEHVKSEVCK